MQEGILELINRYWKLYNSTDLNPYYNSLQEQRKDIIIKAKKLTKIQKQQ